LPGQDDKALATALQDDGFEYLRKVPATYLTKATCYIASKAAQQGYRI
jgi:hypothetical protein